MYLIYQPLYLPRKYDPFTFLQLLPYLDCFCHLCGFYLLRFYFLSYLLEQGLQTTAFSPHPAQCLFLQIKLYWKAATSICLNIPKVCFHAAMAELSHRNTGHMAHKVKDVYHQALTENVCWPCPIGLSFFFLYCFEGHKFYSILLIVIIKCLTCVLDKV